MKNKIITKIMLAASFMLGGVYGPLNLDTNRNTLELPLDQAGHQAKVICEFDLNYPNNGINKPDLYNALERLYQKKQDEFTVKGIFLTGSAPSSAGTSEFFNNFIAPLLTGIAFKDNEGNILAAIEPKSFGQNGPEYIPSRQLNNIFWHGCNNPDTQFIITQELLDMGATPTNYVADKTWSPAGAWVIAE